MVLVRGFIVIIFNNAYLEFFTTDNCVCKNIILIKKFHLQIYIILQCFSELIKKSCYLNTVLFGTVESLFIKDTFEESEKKVIFD